MKLKTRTDMTRFSKISSRGNTENFREVKIFAIRHQLCEKRENLNPLN